MKNLAERFGITKKMTNVHLKRITALVLAVVLFATMLPIVDVSSVFAANDGDIVPSELGEPQITMVTALPVGSEFSIQSIRTTSEADIYIDWGDGNPQKSTAYEYFYDGYGYLGDYTGEVAGENIRIFSAGEIDSFSCNSGELSSLDVSNCPALRGLYCDENSLSEIDVTDCPELRALFCRWNQITDLDLSQCPELGELFCQGNRIASLDLSNCKKISALWADNIGLENLIYPEDNEAEDHSEFFVSENSLRFSMVKNALSDNYAIFGYSNQGAIPVVSTAIAGEEYTDLASEYDINGTKTVYTWYNAANDEPIYLEESGDGVFTFGNEYAGMRLYCTMTNELFPDLTLTTTEVKIVASVSGKELVLPSNIDIGGTVDWSDFCVVDGETTKFTWYEFNIYKPGGEGDGYVEVTPTTAENGVFTFGEEFDGYVLSCVVENSRISEPPLHIRYMTVNRKGFEEPQIVFTTDVPVGGYISFDAFTHEHDLRIDGAVHTGEYGWSGLGKYQVTDSTIKLYSTGPIPWIYFVSVDSEQQAQGNVFTSIDVSNCPALTLLSVECGSFSQIDVSKNLQMRGLEFFGGELTDIDVSNNSELRVLICSDNNLSALDVSNNPELTELRVENNNLTSIKYPDKVFDGYSPITIENNRLKFSDMPQYDALDTLPEDYDPEYINNFTYSPQNVVIEIEKKVTAGTGSIDLSSECDIYGTKTVYTWYDVPDEMEAHPDTDGDGVFTFDEDMVGRTLYCVMTNELYPDLILTTTEVTVEAGEQVPEVPELGEPQITMTTELPAGDSISFEVAADDAIYIDWGDGRIVEYSKDGVIAGSNIKLYSSGNIISFKNNQIPGQISWIDISKAIGLETFAFNGGKLSSSDFRNNPKLTYLDCEYCGLSEIDISQNTQLTILRCGYNQLTALDVSKNINLESLSCYVNKLSNLDISRNTELERLACGDNRLTVLDISNNSSLVQLQLENQSLAEDANHISALDITENPNLKYLTCYGEAVDEIILNKGQSVEVQILRDDGAVEYVWSSSNEEVATVEDSTITAVGGGKSTVTVETESKSANCVITVTAETPELGEPKIVMTKDTTESSNLWIDMTTEPADASIYIDWGDGQPVISIPSEYNTHIGTVVGDTVKVYCAESITSLDCSFSGLTALDVSGCAALEVLDCSGNNLSALDVSSNTELTDLDCYNNNLSELDVSNNVKLTVLSCDSNNLSELDVSNNVKLTVLSCDENDLSELDVSNNVKLTDLSCGSNNLSELDVSNNTELTSLECSYNNLSELDITGNQKLETLSFRFNNLSELDISKNTNLIWLWLEKNNLTEINLKNNPELRLVEVSKNPMQSIDISANQKLDTLFCGFTPMSYVDISNNPMLNNFFCYSSNFTFDTLPVNVETDLFASEGEPAIISNYGPQNDMVIVSSSDAGREIDLSSQYDIAGSITTYTWYYGDGSNCSEPASGWDQKDHFYYPGITTNISTTDSAAVPTSSENGVFTFGDEFVGETLYCLMTNELFPDLTLKTTAVTIVAGDDIIVDDSAVSDADVEAEPEDDFSCVDKNNKPVDVAGIKLIVGNVEESHKKTVADAVARYNEHFDVEQSTYAMYDISLVDKESGTKVEVVEGKIRITIKIPENFPGQNKGYTFNLYHYKDDGTVEEIPITLTNGSSHFWFYADDFSPYVLTATPTAEINYSLTPAIKGAASKLYEPWGLKYFASYDGDDVDKIAERGVVMLKDEFYTTGMTPEAFRASENAYDFSSARDELGFEAPSTKYPNGRYTALLDEGIYSYDISAAYYALPYAVMENGQIVYGTIRNISMEQVLNSNLSSSAVSAEEKTICNCILALKESVATYYSATGIQGASVDIRAPRGSSQTAASKVMTPAESGITPAVKGAASRLIEPWGLKFTAAYTADSRIADRGIVMLREDSYSDTYASNQDAMRLNAEAYVFTEGDETLQYVASSDRYSALLTEGISSRDISAAYYAAPFVVLNDGTYVYGTVRSISMLNILNTNLSSSAVSAEEKAVCQDIIDLYNAVKAFYEAA